MTASFRDCAILLALPLALLASPTIEAQGTSTYINGAAGLSVATGSFGDRNDAGYSLLLGLGISQAAAPLSFRAEAMYNEFDQRSFDGKSRATALTANAIYDFSMGPQSPVAPYVIGGIGYYTTREPDPFFDVDSQSNVGWNLGGGARFALSGFSVYAEARYHSVGNVGVKFAPIVFGVTTRL